MIRVTFFAAARDAAGRETTEVSNADVQTIADLRKILADPKLENILPRCAIAVNLAYVDDDHALQDGDEVAILPPVSGG